MALNSARISSFSLRTLASSASLSTKGLVGPGGGSFFSPSALSLATSSSSRRFALSASSCSATSFSLYTCSLSIAFSARRSSTSSCVAASASSSPAASVARATRCAALDVLAAERSSLVRASCLARMPFSDRSLSSSALTWESSSLSVRTSPRRLSVSFRSCSFSARICSRRMRAACDSTTLLLPPSAGAADPAGGASLAEARALFSALSTVISRRMRAKSALSSSTSASPAALSVWLLLASFSSVSTRFASSSFSFFRLRYPPLSTSISSRACSASMRVVRS
mmetsp:Transcript_36539/g.91617  ORF Transcript_36539/g.91617 Transcript_36539/m.91617 type:complete len:283 (-) Transcript_36539:189-1037(-)